LGPIIYSEADVDRKFIDVSFVVRMVRLLKSITRTKP
jgi:hypothetical protein